jgi:cell division septum initiation protein DivIVA
MKKMMKMDISFNKRIFGYDMEQVRRYVEKISDAYQTAYDEYNSLSAKYEELTERFAKESISGQAESGAEFIAKAMLSGEVLVKKLINDAKDEAAKIIEASEKIKAEALFIKENAFIERATVELQAQRVIDTADSQAETTRENLQKAIQEASAELERINETAQKTVHEAGVEAERIQAAALKTVSDANDEAEEAKTAAHKLVIEAYAEVESARETAKRIMESAINEAAKIKETLVSSTVN